MLTATSEVFKAQHAFASVQEIVRICSCGIYSSAIPHIDLSKTSLLALKESRKPDQTQPLTHHNYNKLLCGLKLYAAGS